MDSDLPRQNKLLASRTKPFSAGRALVCAEELWPLLSVGLVLLLWGTSLQNVDLRRMSDLGLVSVLPPTFFVAFFLLTVSFSLVLSQQPVRVWILLLHVVVLIFMVHGTPALLYETLRYSWAWKHVGMVDYIQRRGSVDPTNSYLLDSRFLAYHSWPGFFASSAFITEVAGFKNALSSAQWSPVFFNLLNLGALQLIVKVLHSRPTSALAKRLVFLPGQLGWAGLFLTSGTELFPSFGCVRNLLGLVQSNNAATPISHQ
jgi:hypothetical protein